MNLGFQSDDPTKELKFSAPNQYDCKEGKTPHVFTGVELRNALKIAYDCENWNQGKGPGPVPACCMLAPPDPVPSPNCCKTLNGKTYPRSFANDGFTKFPVDGGKWPNELWEFPLEFYSAHPPWCGGNPDRWRVIMDKRYDFQGILFHPADNGGTNEFEQSYLPDLTVATHESGKTPGRGPALGGAPLRSEDGTSSETADEQSGRDRG
ncbi:uncharacterized protein B0I36DRAFT_352573 [Microdochium trichocladiopsis]|uniref:Uncharacterized protein n=1 Tax=Microdochium trichocladiopsis TaxID=1682393 RepID=A0A9P9BLF5_9PEZI|nr:uncharacterized protein B0I36DRAFT_352573 [Microdochium trichocladiopsis]KAH7024325.1 hypothetical protein B0I36DRAFT_352573 [Microdochium trichocladiopsis]